MFCDICGEETDDRKINTLTVSVIRTLETDGTRPFIQKQEMEVCDNCMRKLVVLRMRQTSGKDDHKHFVTMSADERAKYTEN